MCRKLLVSIAFALFMPFSTFAQNVVSIKALLQRALDSSHVLYSNKYLIQQAETRNTNGYAGNLPSLVLSGQSQYELNSSRLEFFDGGVSNASNASNYSAGASIDITYPIYEAGAKELRKNKLNIAVNDALITTKIDQQDIVLAVLQAASNLELYRAQIKTYKQDTSYWKELLDLREQMMSFGKGTRIDLIQIESELNRSSTQLERAIQQYEMAKIRLQDLTFLDERDSIPQLALLSYLQKKGLQTPSVNSPLLDQAQNDLRQAELSMDLAKTLQYPILSGFAGYGYNWSRNAVGVLLSNQNFGPYVGLSVNWNLYDGDRTKTEIQSTKLQIAADQAKYNAVERDLEYSLKRLRTALNHQQTILQQERAQYELLQTQFEIIQEQYRQGRIDILQVLNFQRELRLTQLNIANAAFQIRNYLIQLLYTKGSLTRIE